MTKSIGLPKEAWTLQKRKKAATRAAFMLANRDDDAVWQARVTLDQLALELKTEEPALHVLTRQRPKVPVVIRSKILNRWRAILPCHLANRPLKRHKRSTLTY